MPSKGIIPAVIIIIVIIIIIILAIVLRDIYSRNRSEFGTWTDFTTTICLNEGQPCTVQGTSQRYRDCIPNPSTGKGCIDSNGNQTYNREILNVPCNPICFTSVWDTTVLQPCTVFTDMGGTMPKSDTFCVVDNDCPGVSTCDSGVCTSCALNTEFRYQKIFRTCINKDINGTNGCVKNDGTLASVGESETVLIPCDTVDFCYPGDWDSCGLSCINDGDCSGVQTCENGFCQPNNIQSSTCSMIANDCGRLILTPTSSVCRIGGNIVSNSNCNPSLEPSCETSCFVWPCMPFPSGFTNISSFQNGFLELFNNAMPTMYLVADFATFVTALANNPLNMVLGSNIIVVNAPLHGFFENQIIGLQGSLTTHGIPAVEINDFFSIFDVTTNTFSIMVSTSATSTGTGGGNNIDTLLSQEEIAKAQNQDIFTTGNVDIAFGTTALDRVRIKLIPSQAEVPNGAFYMLAYIPYSGQEGIVEWDGAKLTIRERPVFGINETFDDVVPPEDRFAFTNVAAPYVLNTYTPGPTYTPILGVNFDADVCDDSLNGTCI